MNKIIAIDYDGTITDNTPFPNEAKIRPEAVKYIKLLYEKGYKLVLWTARYGDYYTQCIDSLKLNNLYNYFDFNYSKCGETGKLIADFYIDDRSWIIDIDWQCIYTYIINKLGE